MPLRCTDNTRCVCLHVNRWVKKHLTRQVATAPRRRRPALLIWAFQRMSCLPFPSASLLLLLVSPWQRRVQRDLWRCLQTDTRLPHLSAVQRMTELNQSIEMRACSSSRAEIALNTATNNQSCVIALLWIVCVNGDEDEQMQWSWRKSVYKAFYVLDERSLFQKADCSDSAGTPLKRFALVYRTGSHRQFRSISFQLSVLCFCLACRMNALKRDSYNIRAENPVSLFCEQSWTNTNCIISFRYKCYEKSNMTQSSCFWATALSHSQSVQMFGFFFSVL